MPSTRAKSLPRPPGMTPSGTSRPGERAADLADQAVAADHDGDRSLGGGRGSEPIAAVVDVGRALDGS